MTRSEAAQIARDAKMKKQPPLNVRFWSKVDVRGDEECWPWVASVRRAEEGYGAFWLDRRHQPSNRVAWILTYGHIPHGEVVCHKCDNPRCCNPSHLFLGTPLQNNDDKVAKNRHAYGSRNGLAKLTEDQAREIISLKPERRSPRGYRSELAMKYGVSMGTITDVWTRRWNHLK